MCASVPACGGYGNACPVAHNRACACVHPYVCVCLPSCRYHGFYGFKQYNETSRLFQHGGTAFTAAGTPQPASSPPHGLSVATAATLVTTKWCGFGGMPHRSGCITALYSGVRSPHVPAADTMPAFAARDAAWTGVAAIGDASAHGVTATYPDTPHRPTLAPLSAHATSAAPVILGMAGVPSGVHRLAMPPPQAVIMRHADAPPPAGDTALVPSLAALVQQAQQLDDAPVQGSYTSHHTGEAAAASDTTSSVQWCSGMGVAREGWVDALRCPRVDPNATRDAVLFDTRANIAQLAVGPRSATLVQPSHPPAFLTATPQPASWALDWSSWEEVARVPLELRAANWWVVGGGGWLRVVFVFVVASVSCPHPTCYPPPGTPVCTANV